MKIFSKENNIAVFLVLILLTQLDFIHAQDEALRYPQVPVCASVSPAGTPGITQMPKCVDCS